MALECHPLRSLGLAVQFLTRAPVHLSGPVSDSDLARSMVFYPWVGAGLGTILAAFGFELQLLLPPAVAVVWILTASAVFTGNLHLDGLTDTVDGLYGAFEPERRLAIMKDSRVGAHGVVAAILVLAMKAVLLLQFESIQWWWILPLTLGAGRWALVYGVYRFPYARSKGGVARAYMDHVRASHFWLATCFALITGAVITPTPVHVVAAGAGAFGTGFVAGRYINRKIGGMTGDTLGALNEVVELVVLTIFVVMQR